MSKAAIPALQRRIAELEASLEAALAKANQPVSQQIVYVDNPAHLDTIRALQDKLCQFTSQ